MIFKCWLQKYKHKILTLIENIFKIFFFIFYEQKESRHILFKGGTALRIVFQSPYISEDLDFSTNKIFSLKDVEQIIIKIKSNNYEKY